jgi:hypothetical protein
LLPHEVADLGLRLFAVAEALRSDVAVRANVIRADCNAHLSVPESVPEGFEDVWALVSDCDNVSALGQGSLNSLKSFCP